MHQQTLSTLRFALLATSLVAMGGCGIKGSPFTQQPTMRPATKAAPKQEASSPAEAASSQTLPLQTAPVGVPAQRPDDSSPDYPPGVLFQDFFADMRGAIKRHENGMQLAQGPRATRQLFFFLGKPEGGAVTLQMQEDATTTGPDGQAGVLSFSWQEVPPALPYSGFAYLGHTLAPRRMTLPPLQTAKSPQDLEGIRLKFQFKGAKADSAAPVQINVGCRLEPNLPDSYNKRLDMGRFVAGEEWSTYDAALTEGTNIEKFLHAIVEEKPTSFKLIWAQAGKIKDYAAGDTFFIDDVVIGRSLTNATSAAPAAEAGE